MIVIDSSVWLAHFRGFDTETVRKFRALPGPDGIMMGDLIPVEILHAARIERELSRFPIAAMLGPSLAVRAAENYRRLRGHGVTVRKTVDIIIGTFCIEGGHRLLHADRDFDHMAMHLSLLVA